MALLTLVSRLPADRREPGELVATDGTALIGGPWRCLGKADNAAAAEHGNAMRDPCRPFGDHPAGVYRLSAAHTFTPGSSTYGPGWIALDPISGDAGIAKAAGRFGLLIHGGALRDGHLRPTFGCLRVDDATIDALLDFWATRQIGPGSTYRCEVTR